MFQKVPRKEICHVQKVQNVPNILKKCQTKTQNIFQNRNKKYFKEVQKKIQHTKRICETFQKGTKNIGHRPKNAKRA